MGCHNRKMSRMIRLLPLLALLCALGLAQTAIRVTTQAVSLHAQASSGSPVIRVVPSSASLTLKGCSGDWRRVTYKSSAGYVPRASLATKPATVSRGSSHASGKGYVNSQGNWIPSPVFSQDGPPAGASAKCNDGSYSFSASRRGTCSHHGGVAVWY